MLLTGAGLMLKSFLRLRSVNPGFVSQSVMTLTVDLEDSTHRTAGQMQAFHTRALAELSVCPGAVVAGAVDWLPLGDALGNGRISKWKGDLRPRGFIVDKPCASPAYFRLMGIRLLRGREFTERDNKTAPGVVHREPVRRTNLWPGEDPVESAFRWKIIPNPKIG